MNAQTYASVWDGLVDDPDEAADLTARSILLIGVRDRVRAWSLPDEMAAHRLGIAPDTLRDLRSANLACFSHAALLDLSRRAGCDVG